MELVLVLSNQLKSFTLMNMDILNQTQYMMNLWYFKEEILFQLAI